MDKHVIAIVTYNRLSLLQECLNAVVRQKRPFDGIVIIDNASTDGTRDFLRTWKKETGKRCFDDSCRVIWMHSNCGGAGGFCKAVEEAMKLDPDWITLIDDDAVPERDYLEQICKGIASSESGIEAVAGVPLTNGIRPGHRRRVSGRIIKKELPVPVEEYRRPFFCCDIASFCGLTISAQGVLRVGLPDRRFFIWYDDTEYCLRLSENHTILNCNKAVIQHKVPDKSAADSVNWKEYYGIRNRIYMACHHYNHATAAAIAVKKMFTSLTGAAKYLEAGRVKEAKKMVSMTLEAVSDGFGGRLGKNPRYLP